MYSPMRCPGSSPPIRTSGTCRGQLGSVVMWSTPAPSEKIARRFGSPASHPGGGAQVSA